MSYKAAFWLAVVAGLLETWHHYNETNRLRLRIQRLQEELGYDWAKED